MKKVNMRKRTLLPIMLLISIGLFNCQSNNEILWIKDCSIEDRDSCGFKNINGEVEIAYGKYPMIFTDTFRNYAIVLNPEEGFVGIDKNENTLFKVFTYDNGPDYEVEGFFRVEEDGKIGFVDGQTGTIVIEPRFSAAQPFENGYAAICADCTTRSDGEHTTWVDGEWGLINKKGEMVMEPAFERIVSIGTDGSMTIIENGEEKEIEIRNLK